MYFRVILVQTCSLRPEMPPVHRHDGWCRACRRFASRRFASACISRGAFPLCLLAPRRIRDASRKRVSVCENAGDLTCTFAVGDRMRWCRTCCEASTAVTLGCFEVCPRRRFSCECGEMVAKCLFQSVYNFCKRQRVHECQSTVFFVSPHRPSISCGPLTPTAIADRYPRHLLM